jgi:hypothetical protein
MPQLAQLVREKYPGVYDDLDDAALEQAVRSKYPGVYDDLAEPKAEHPHARLARVVGENLPAVGGAIGGMLGAVGGPVVAAGTAGLGGAAGRLAQRAVAGDVNDVGEMATDAAVEGGKQGAIESVGGGLGRGVNFLGKRLYRGLAKPSKALREQYPDAIDTLVDEGATLTHRGLGKVEGALGKSAQKADAMIDAAAPTATLIKPKEIVSQFGGTVKELRKRADIGQPSELGRVGERGRRIVATGRNGGIDLKRAQELKRTAQNAANAGYRQAERGTVKEVGADTLLDKDVARGLRGAIERRVPGIDVVNRRTQSLGGAKDVVDDALQREGNNLAFGGAKEGLAALGAMGGYAASGGDADRAVQLGVLTRLLATPSTGSMAAIGMNRLGRSPIIQNAIRSLLMATHESEP